MSYTSNYCQIMQGVYITLCVYLLIFDSERGEYFIIIVFLKFRLREFNILGKIVPLSNTGILVFYEYLLLTAIRGLKVTV